MVGEPVEHGCGHLGVAENLRPIGKGEVGRDDDRGVLVELADEVEQQLRAGLAEGEILEVGQGTTVCIYLPRHYGAVADDDAVEKAADLPRSQAGETVLIVDDEPTVRMLITDILEDLGYAAIEAGDSATGLKVLQSDVRIDLLVTDVGLPGGMNGRQMADAARVSRPDLKVLFITGYAENALLSTGQLGSGMAVLTKPFAIDTMAARIRSMIEGGKERARHVN